MKLKYWVDKRLKGMVLALAGVLVLSACGQNRPKEMTTPLGLKYAVVRAGSGEIAKKDEFMILNLLYKDDTDSVWLNTADRGIPISIPRKDSVWSGNEGSIEEIFYQLKKEDSITFDIAAGELFSKTWNTSIPEGSLKPESVLSFYVGVEDILDQAGIAKWQEKMMKRYEVYMQKEADLQVGKDKEIIEAFLKKNGIEAKETPSGLKYVITEEGKGSMPESGQKVKVNYTGRVLGGEYFDTSIKAVAEEQGLYNAGREPYEPLEFALGAGMVIKGWDEGIALLKEGGKATLYIPSGLAYGPQARSAKIPANAILIFDVELVSISEE